MGYWDKKKPEPEEPVEETVTLEDIEKDTIEELGEVEKGFRERMKQENKRFRDMCDTEYWCCVCFTSREQKEEFLKKIGMDTDLKYIDGHEMAKAFRKSLKTPDLEFAQIRPFDKEYLDRSADFPKTDTEGK